MDVMGMMNQMQKLQAHKQHAAHQNSALKNNRELDAHNQSHPKLQFGNANLNKSHLNQKLKLDLQG